MKQILLLSGRCLVVELPEGAESPIYEEDEPNVLHWVEHGETEMLTLPPGNWRIIGMLSEVTEMDAIPLVDKERFIVDGPDLGFRNYKGNKYDWFGTAIESLYSAIEATGWHFDNPYVDAGLIPSFGLERFRAAQSRVLDRSRCLLLGREPVSVDSLNS